MKKKSIITFAVIFLVITVFLILCTTFKVSHKININESDEVELYSALLEVDGIGEVLAERIVQNRPYKDWDDLRDSVSGIGDEKVGALKNSGFGLF
ncbi:MAG: helix-hairpin-helix domain-containing protein [Oscillospiraceae bacterium]|nr:helix-hairpin-helix domain-containing protein [Oscillospiraceae bacterium]